MYCRGAWVCVDYVQTMCRLHTRCATDDPQHIPLTQYSCVCNVSSWACICVGVGHLESIIMGMGICRCKRCAVWVYHGRVYHAHVYARVYHEHVYDENV